MKPIAMTEWGTFRWIGDGGRPTDAVVEHLLRLRWPGRSDQTGLTATPAKWQLYTLDRQPSTIWSLAAIWPRQGHVSADFLTWS